MASPTLILCTLFLRGTFLRVVVGRLGYRLPEGQDVAKRVPVQSRWGVDGCVVVARLWRKEAREEAVARRGATLLAENAEHEQAPTIAVDVGPPPARGLDVREEGREMDDAAKKPWNDKARAGQEKYKADEERWKKMSPDERLVHFPPSPSLGPSPPPPPPTDTKPSKKRGAASCHFDDAAPPRRRRGGGVAPTRTSALESLSSIWRRGPRRRAKSEDGSEKKKKKKKKKRASSADPDADTQL